jgi:hypothetical protein
MTTYNDNFISYCEKPVYSLVSKLCAEGPFEMVHQGIDIAINKNDMRLLHIILSDSRPIFDRLVQYMINRKYIDQLIYWIELKDTLAKKLLYSIICTGDMLAMESIKEILTHKKYIKTRSDTLRMFCRLKIIDSRYNSVITPKFNIMKLAILYLAKDVIITLDMKQIMVCIDIMLDYYSTSLNELIRLFEVCNVAQYEKAPAVIKKIQTELISILDTFLPADICKIIITFVLSL